MHPGRLSSGIRGHRQAVAPASRLPHQTLPLSSSSIVVPHSAQITEATPTSTHVTAEVRAMMVAPQAHTASVLRTDWAAAHHTLALARRAYSTRGETRHPAAAPLSAFGHAAEPLTIPYSANLIIGDVVMPVPDFVLCPERVPFVVPGTYDGLDGLLARVAGEQGVGGGDENMFFSVSDPLTRYYLRWLCQKELLGQDMCLLGDPGPALRWLVLLYAHLTRREVCVVSLNRDITESDLKQRREIRNGTLVYEDQSAVTAAKEGHLLVLDGLERVERNVLPVINNLLENREMHLDNGSVLIHPSRYDALLRDAMQARLAHAARTGTPTTTTMTAHTTAEARVAATADLANMGLLRVSERFRVVGITVPVPPYEGSPLDPPLRSRFQCLYVRTGLPAMPTRRAPFLQSADTARAARVDQIQAQRLGAMVKFHAAVDAINESTSAFANSRPSATRPARSPRDGRGGRGQRLPSPPRSRPGETDGEDGDGADDGADSSAPAQPIRNVGNFEMGVVARQLHVFPDLPVGEALVRGFPWPLYALAQSTGADGSALKAQETEKIANHYRSVLAGCGIQAPLLLPTGAGTGLSGQGGRRGGGGGASSASAHVAAAFRALVGSGQGESEARTFIQSAGLLNSVHHGDATATAVTVPQSVAEISNYIVRLENPRVCACEGTEALDQAMCVADAVVATASQAAASRGGGRGTYVIPVTVGRYAELRLLDHLSHSTQEAVTQVVDVAQRCAGSNMVLTTELYHALQTMLQLHASRQHLLLVGAPGGGKTALIREFAHLLGYEIETMHLYADMTNKDLFQRRTTDAKSGNTTWDNTALVDAAIHGRLVVLDGVDKLPPGMLTSLQQLLVDHSVNLFDGTTLKPQEEYAILKDKMSQRDPVTGEIVHRATDADMREKKIFPIHPAFRVIATARPPGSGGASGAGAGGSGASASSGASGGAFNHDMTTLFGVVTMPDARRATLEPVLYQVAMREVEAMVAEGLLPEAAQSARRATSKANVERLLRLRDEVTVLRQSDPKIMPLTFRQLLHLVRGAVRFPAQLPLSVSNALLVSLMTGVTLTQVTDALQRCGLASHHGASASSSSSSAAPPPTQYESLTLEESASTHPTTPATTTSTSTTTTPSSSWRRTYMVNESPVLVLTRTYTARELALVPFVTGFHANPVHETIIAWLAKQYGMGANTLLIGNQGVGKNKVVDAFLSRVRIPRHYLQLHRDTTVGSLTINPTVEGGKVRWEDSPLVKAVQQGHCLVVDEVDKAPVEVVQVLKGLIEDREMRLGDGRRIVDAELFTKIQATGADTSGLLAIHPDFRIIVLANPPGFPFHGNDFFRECGDLFSSYVMVNPDRASQLQVLEAYAPTLPQPLMVSLIEAFRQLQDGFSQGNLSYPFSLRELIAVVKHLSRFPQDGVYEALNNVFNFDARDDNTLRYVRQVLHHYLSPHTAHGASARLLPLRAGQPHKLTPLPEPITVPYEHTTTTTGGAAAGAATTASQLGAQMNLNRTQLREAVRDTVADCPPIVFWRQRFAESDFYDRQASTAMTAGGFTEWMSVRTMPFIDAASDTVLGVTTAGQYADMGEAGSLVSFLLLRRPSPSTTSSSSLSQKPAIVLATVRLPPAPLDSSAQPRTSVTGAGAGAASLLAWPIGEVHFMDVTAAATSHTSFSGADQAGLTLEDFNAAALADVWARPSEAMLGERGVLSMRRRVPPWTGGRGSGGENARDGEAHEEDEEEAADPCPPTVMLHCGGSGKALLVDLLASPSTVAPLTVSPATTTHSNKRLTRDAQSPTATALPSPPPPSSSSSSSSSASPATAVRFELRGALLPLDLSTLVQPNSTTSPASVRGGALGAAGLVWEWGTAPASNTLRLLSAGCVVSVMAPLPLVGVRFIRPRLAAVTMQGVSSEGHVHGVLHVSVNPHSGDVSALFAALPSGLAGPMEVVDVLPKTAVTTTAAASSASVTSQPQLLRGLVLAPRRETPSDDVAAKTTSTKMDAAYVVVEDANAQSVALRLYPADTRVAQSRAPIAVDAIHHQLVQDGGVVIDPAAGTGRQLAAPPLTPSADPALWSMSVGQQAIVAYAPGSRQLSVADLNVERVQRRYADWSAMLSGSAGDIGDGADPDSEKRIKPFNMEYSTPRKQPSGTLKHGEVDDKEHHGGNTWAGGTGGTDTAGLGGMVGPYRLDKGNTVHQVSPEEKRKVPKHLIEEARRMGKEALRDRLAAIGMSEEEYAQYNQLQERVRPSINQLRTLLMGLKASEGERTWLKGQSDGVWDDKKLVEGIVGEKNVYKRRVDSKDTNPFQQKHRKRVVFVLDVSASMYRFEGMDHRLTKLIESTIMVMEAFAGFESKIDYCLMGHNGDDEAIKLVDFGHPPANQRERMEVCMKMIAYAQYCWSGDNTVEAMRHSLDVVTKEKGDSYFVFVISDANLRQYGITPQELSSIILSRKPEVQMFCIFIATLGAQASQLQKQLPAGHGYECMKTDELPHILRKIFSSVNLL